MRYITTHISLAKTSSWPDLVAKVGKCNLPIVSASQLYLLMVSLVHIIILGTAKVKRKSRILMYGYRKWIKGNHLIIGFV